MSVNNSKATLDEILDYLCNKDEKFRSIVDTVSLPFSCNPSDGFCLLVETIISQQLSNKASETIFNRFLKKHNLEFGFQPSELDSTPENIRNCGVSTAKANFILSIRDELKDNTEYFQELSLLSDNDIEYQLTKLKGVGGWTARILMISLYGRLDVFPYNDSTLISAVRLMGYDDKSIHQISINWAPYRSVAARLLWNAYDKGWLLSKNDI